MSWDNTRVLTTGRLATQDLRLLRVIGKVRKTGKDLDEEEVIREEWFAVDRQKQRTEPTLVKEISGLFIDQRDELVRNVSLLQEFRHNPVLPSRLRKMTNEHVLVIEWETDELTQYKDLAVALRLFDLNKWEEETRRRVSPLFPGVMETGFNTGALRVGLEGTNFNADTDTARETMRRTLEKTVGINRTTLQVLATSIIPDWLESGKDTDALAQMIHDRFTQYSIGRAGRIGRTATGSLFEGGQLQAYQEAEIEVHMWITRRDGLVRTRPRSRFDHRAADGETVKVGEFFTRTGEKLKHPLDPIGSAGNVVECRCSTLPKIGEPGDGGPDDDEDTRPPPPEPVTPPLSDPVAPPPDVVEVLDLDDPEVVRAEMIRRGEPLQARIDEIAPQINRLQREIPNLPKDEILPNARKLAQLQREFVDLKKQRAESVRELILLPEERSGRLVEDVDYKLNRGAKKSWRIKEAVDDFSHMFSRDLLVEGEPAKFIRTVMIKLDQRVTRSYFQGGEVHLSGDSKRVAIHELGHWLEVVNKSVSNETARFFEERTKGEVTKTLRSLTGTRSYGRGEVAKKDKFIEAYMGKVYAGSRSTELLSMGMELLWDDPVRLAQEDPDYFDFIFQLLRGKRRDGSSIFEDPQ